MQNLRTDAITEFQQERYRENRVTALQAASTWLSGPTGGVSPTDVVETARVFEDYLNELER